MAYILPVNGHHLEFTLRFWSAVIAVISGNSAVLKQRKIYHCIVHHWSFTLLDIMMPFHSEINVKKASTDICSRGRQGTRCEFLDG